MWRKLLEAMKEDVRRFNIASQPTRLRILQHLPSNAYKLTEELKINYKVCTHHLKTLEKADLISGKYIKSDKPVLIKQYEITSKGKQIMSHILRIEQIK